MKKAQESIVAGTTAVSETLEVRFKNLTAANTRLEEANERLLGANERLQADLNHATRDCDRARGERDQARKELDRIMEVIRLMGGKGRDKYDDYPPFFRSFR